MTNVFSLIHQKWKRISSPTENTYAEILAKDKKTTELIDPRYIFFGQQHTYTIQHFQEIFGSGWTRIPITESPHYHFVIGDEKPYLDYLDNSWRYFYGDDIPSSKIEEQIYKFRNLIEEIKEARVIRQPLDLYWGVDGEMVIADGNHRSAISAALGLKCPANIQKTEHAIKDIINIPEETFGSGANDMPYQTIYHGRRALLEGRRSDLITRIEAIQNAFPIKGKTLLDFGANYGMSSYLALRLGGVKNAHLVESSHDLTQAAIRLSVLLNSPNKTFSVGNLKDDLSKFLPVCDIGFCFSITAHVGDINNLAKTVHSNVSEVLFYETHEGRELEPEIAGQFATYKKLCDLGRRQLFMLSHKKDSFR